MNHAAKLSLPLPRRPRVDTTRYLAYVLIAGLGAVYFHAILSLSVNGPWFDDYITFLGAYARLGQAPSPADFLGVLWEQITWHGAIKSDHRLGFARSVMFLSEAGFGAVNFRHLIVIGNSFIVFWLLIVWANSRVARARPILLLPVALFVFSLAHWEAAIWASAALLYYPAAFFALFALTLALKWRHGLAPGLASGALGALAQANGLVALPVLAAALAFVRRWRAALVALICAALAFALYFHDFSRPKIPPYASLGHAVHAIGLSWLQLQGNAVRGLELPLGIVGSGFWLWLLWRRAWRDNPVLFWFGVWLLASMAAVALGRASFSDDFVVAQHRYRYYGIGFLGVTYLLCLEHLARPAARKALFAVMLALGAYTYAKETPYFWAQMAKTRIDGVLAGNHYAMEGVPPRDSLWYPANQDIAELFAEAGRRGIYHVPFERDIVAVPITAPSVGAPPTELAWRVEPLYIGRRGIGLAGMAPLGRGRTCADTATAVFLQGTEGRYWFRPVRFARAKIKEVLVKPCQMFATYIPTDLIPPGVYRLGVALVVEGRVVEEGSRPEPISLTLPLP